jgi:hypothetical protein
MALLKLIDRPHNDSRIIMTLGSDDSQQLFTENSLNQKEKRHFVRRDVAGADHQETETAGL